MRHHPTDTATRSIDLNSDVGEGYGIWRLGDDEALMDICTSINVACGFHAGDPSIMRQICDGAAERGISIGAQVSYHDLAGFGRHKIEVPKSLLADQIVYQIGALDGFAKVAGTKVRYVKPHGALNHATVTDAVQASAVTEAVARYDPGLAVLAQPGSELERLSRESGLSAVPEAFADRGYTENGTLVPRGQPGAVLDDPELIAERAVRMVRDHAVRTTGGRDLFIAPQSLCVHGDTPGAADLARRTRAALQAAGYELRAFRPP